MIESNKGYSIKLEDCIRYFEIYSYERIILKPQEKKLIHLPIHRKIDIKIKYMKFEVDKNLILKGLQVLYTNINEKESFHNIQMILYNSNIDYSIINRTQSPIYKITGSLEKIDLIPNTLLGKLFI